jgi:glutaconate CoA-transferase subunit B
VKSTAADTLVALMASALTDGAVVATGVASPLGILAIAVAQATHAPRLRYLACVGALDPELGTLHRSSEDLRFLDGRSGDVAIPDLFDHARRGRIDTIFFGAAQVDGHGRTNMSAIGSLARPKVKLPGVAGAATLRRWIKRPVIVVPKHTRRTLVSAVDVVSTADPRRRVTLLTDLATFELGEGGAVLTSRHSWASYEQIAERTGFSYAIADGSITNLPAPATIDAINSIDKHGLRHALIG